MEIFIFTSLFILPEIHGLSFKSFQLWKAKKVLNSFFVCKQNMEGFHAPQD